jgi:23S rRNA pseudouridine2605 synthase
MNQRLQVIIAHAGIASRRKAEELITDGKVQINGKTVTELGSQADVDKDTIIVNGKPIPHEQPTYVLLNKPKNVVSTASDPDGKQTVNDLFTRWWKKNNPDQPAPRVYPVGRLDEESEGLILLTNDGDLAYKLTHPKFEVPKTYHIFIQGSPSNTSLNALKKGIRLKEGVAKADDVSIYKHEAGNTWISITIHQGFNRQIRRMCAHVGLPILVLRRVQLGPYHLGELKTGHLLPTSAVL